MIQSKIIITDENLARSHQHPKMTQRQSISRHFAFIILLGLLMFAVVTVFSYRPIAIGEVSADVVTVTATLISVEHEAVTRSTSHPDSLITIETDDQSRQKIRIPYGARFMESEWKNIKTGDIFQFSYHPFSDRSNQPIMHTMRNNNIYIDQRMIYERIAAHNKVLYWIGITVLLITTPCLAISIWLQQRGKLKPIAQNPNNKNQTSLAIEKKSKSPHRLKYILAAFGLISSAYGLFAADHRAFIVTLAILVALLFFRNR